MFQGCFKSGSRVLKEFFKDVSTVFQGCYKSVSRMFQECFKGVLCVFNRMEVLKVFLRSLKGD